MRPSTPARRHHAMRAALSLLATAALASSCYDGPFAHVNPNDPAARFTMRLESDRDTVSPAHPAVQYSLVTEPAFPGYAPIWSVSIDTMIVHVENGRFTLNEPPEVFQTVQVTARYMSRSVTTSLVMAPTP
ncbi:MAG: hypothetical protein KA761_09710 [Gemmatimonadaceae bacterium]|nr:hypothetical protein [Gemmatimonadaceae bacterium]